MTLTRETFILTAPEPPDVSEPAASAGSAGAALGPPTATPWLPLPVHFAASPETGETSNVESLVPLARPRRSRSILGDGWATLRKTPKFWLAAAIVAFLGVVALAPALFTNSNPRECYLVDSLAPIGPAHPLGGDYQGCDLWSILVYGTRPSISVGLLAASGSLIVGTALGTLAGFFGGLLDAIVSRISDVFFALPLILGSIVAMQVVEQRSVVTLSAIFVVFGWTGSARIARAATIDVATLSFVDAARALGASRLRILATHILPNILGPLIVIFTMSIGGLIGAEASLSYLSIGLPPESVSWGKAISDARALFRVSPGVLLYPAVALTVTVFAFLLLGDAVRDAFDRKAVSR
jgi:oligopeptide transport system permease protein